MAVLKKNQSDLAFWGARSSFITGLDPLGLQISSEAAYTTLLPGITNLTNRIRYYGFYCWLFDHYAHQIRHTGLEEQNAFIRKSELLLAIVMKSHTKDYTQVTGSNYADKLIADGNGGAYDLEAHAVKKGGNTTYWKNESGAFGQYYAGPMGELGLTIRNRDGNIICTTTDHHSGITGTRLAQAFMSTVNEDARTLFLNCVEIGHLTNDAIPIIFEQLALNGIVVGSDEWDLYTLLMLGRDHPLIDVQEDEQITYHRKNTIRYVLRYAEMNDSETVNLTKFPEIIGESKGVFDGERSATLSMWYFYRLNERWQFGAGTVFWCLLRVLEGQLHPHLNQFIESSTEQVSGVLSTFFSMRQENTAQSEAQSFSMTQPEYIEIITSSDCLERFAEEYAFLSLGILTLFDLYSNHYGQITDQFRELAVRHGLLRDGNFIEALDELHHSKLTLREFIRHFIYFRVIQRHQYVAIRKMGNGTQNTLKFMIEENRIRHLTTVEPRFTSPRLGAVTNILTDLSIIDKDGKLTSVGKEFLQNRFSDGD
jgi:hypothetical protein